MRPDVCEVCDVVWLCGMRALYLHGLQHSDLLLQWDALLPKHGSCGLVCSYLLFLLGAQLGLHEPAGPPPPAIPGPSTNPTSSTRQHQRSSVISSRMLKLFFARSPPPMLRRRVSPNGLMKLYTSSLTNIPRYKHHHRGPQPHPRPAGNHVTPHCHCRCHRYQFKFQCPE